ncbi:MAG: TetR/AcrR family transcriptional regulator [Acidimicrobiales bacterium]|nr:TetR/AcrR family transcriptional regulator [Acidimicrobiales bacterium]
MSRESGSSAAPEPGPSTRDALMDAAVEQLRSRGVLAGLNLREVAEAVGVTPANIYYYFGSRQGLLRAALARAAEDLQEPLAEVLTSSFVERRLRIFDAIVANEPLKLTALLALDGDPDYRPMPFLAETQAQLRAMAEAGEIESDVDAMAAHLMGLAASIGFAIYAEAAARQIGLDLEDLTGRARVVFGRMMAAATP